jgi:hypothetical protein
MIAIVVAKQQALSAPNATLSKIESLWNGRSESAAQALQFPFSGRSWTVR